MVLFKILRKNINWKNLVEIVKGEGEMTKFLVQRMKEHVYHKIQIQIKFGFLIN